MAKKPWEEKVVNASTEGVSRQKKKGSFVDTPWLTALLSIFFVIIVAILFIVFYTSNRGGNKAAETTGFYGASSVSQSSKQKGAKGSATKQKAKASSAASSTSTPASSTSETTESTTLPSSSTDASTDASSASGETITVMAGEGAASIAARAGISVEQLQSLNPDHMTQGYWYANPGDQVIVK